jgi:hypothetical protein
LSALPWGGVQVYEIRIAGGEDALKERVARLLCPDEHHPPPCPVPWSFGYGDGTLVLAIYADQATAEDVVEQVRACTPHPVTLADGDPADYEELVEQYRIERR